MNNRLVWMDLEMTGLEPEKDTILEIATLVTDQDLNVVAEGPNLAIHQPEDVLAGMDEWNQTHHGKSGLLARVRASPVSLRDAEAQTLAFVRLHCTPSVSPLCGNSIWQDRRFLFRYMPDLNRHFHYRNIDVSTVKELSQRWYPSLPPYKKAEAHLALADILESVAELRHYRTACFLPTPS